MDLENEKRLGIGLSQVAEMEDCRTTSFDPVIYFVYIISKTYELLLELVLVRMDMLNNMGILSALDETGRKVLERRFWN